jgi:TfoX/Sxy family transcriptional regulator of competence genes
MSYNLHLSARLERLLSGKGVDAKKMFGGIGYLLHGNMLCGVHGNNLIVRVGPDNYVSALARGFVHAFDMTGRPMAGWVEVEPGGVEDDQSLSDWINIALEFNEHLPIK